jgi:hypothetical protein
MVAMDNDLVRKIGKHIKELREIYVRSTIKQRHTIATKRMDHIDSQVLQLCNVVSGLEGFARALLFEYKKSKENDSLINYESIKHYKPSVLIKEYLGLKYGIEAEKYFNQDWELLLLAQEARNLIIHECTYLRQDYTIPLKGSCARIFCKLEEFSGLSSRH